MITFDNLDGEYTAFLIQNQDTCTPAYVHAYFHSFPSVCFSFLEGCGRKRGEIERPMRNVQRAFTPLPASGYACIAAGDSLRSSIINVHRVSQVEVPKSIYSAAFRGEGQVHQILRSAIAYVHTRVCAYPSIKYGRIKRVRSAERATEFYKR